MITYDNLWKTMKKKGISTYYLITYEKISRAQIQRLKKNQSIPTYTLNRLCNILVCDITDILTYTKDEDTP